MSGGDGPRASRILEACLYADDLAEAETFYRDVLGLEPYVREPDRHVFFRCGSAMFLVFRAATTGDPTREHEVPTHGAVGPGHVAFAVPADELDDWRRRLGERGVDIEQEVAWENGAHSIYFRDPAGNSVELATPRLWGL